jgi:threonine aldolase
MGSGANRDEMMMIDLRSDTVTKPSQAMRRAMAEAEVGDDVFGEDPSVNRLQEMTAQLLGKEAALFVPSGTMANQLAIKTHTQPGDEIIMERTSHPFNNESGGIAVLSGVQVNLLDGQRGVLTTQQVVPAIRSGEDIHHSPSRLICLENTHNRGGGAVYPLEAIRQLSAVARAHQLSMHLDGARLMNACIASGHRASEYTQYFDSCTLCFSKGLGAPVGSVLAGSTEFIQRALRFRKMLGGGMRQAGIVAAGAIFALEHNIERLREDHQHAKFLAERIFDVSGLHLNPHEVETNIVYFELDSTARLDAEQLVQAMQQRGVLGYAPAPSTMRLVTHLDVTREQIEQAATVICELLT